MADEDNDYPQLSSALRVSKATNKPSGRLKKNSIGFLVNVANNVFKSRNDVFFLSTSAYMGHGLSVNQENFDRVLANFSARKLVIPTWINDKDCFHIPDVNKIGYEDWLKDCAVYFIFNNANYAASARKFHYKDKYYSLINETFP